jgi:signal transduction histidine kinase
MCPRWLWRLVAPQLFVALSASYLQARVEPARGAAPFEIQNLVVNGKAVNFRGKERVSLGSFPENVFFSFGPRTNASDPPLRLRYRLEGYENAWHEGDAEMALYVRFYNASGDQIEQRKYPVSGESTGWRGSLKTSSLTHRRETLVAPAQSSRLLIVISSAGPPQSVGIYLVADLVVIKPSAAGNVIVLRSPFEGDRTHERAEAPALDWGRNGSRPSMARVVHFGQEPQTRAFGIVDDDPSGHGEWNSVLKDAPETRPGETLVLEWNEMYSIGSGIFHQVNYPAIPAGHYKFRVASVDVLGAATGTETSVDIVALPPFWKTFWFWGAAGVALTAMIAGVSRYSVRRRLRREMDRLKQQRALEQERLRIAHDIHDDLGARATQISLLSAVAKETASSPERARAEFDKISKLARELISALYETVWAVNPENDHLEAQGNYLCQMVSELCEGKSIRCRFHVLDLPHERRISSQTRHNINMVVKEAVHNVIKHSAATEVTLRMSCEEEILSISIEDDGMGFEPRLQRAGNGLTNMKQRLAAMGGSCCIESNPALGTRVLIRLGLNPLSEAMTAADSENDLPCTRRTELLH